MFVAIPRDKIEASGWRTNATNATRVPVTKFRWQLVNGETLRPGDRDKSPSTSPNVSGATGLRSSVPSNNSLAQSNLGLAHIQNPQQEVMWHHNDDDDDDDDHHHHHHQLWMAITGSIISHRLIRKFRDIMRLPRVRQSRAMQWASVMGQQEPETGWLCCAHYLEVAVLCWAEILDSIISCHCKLKVVNILPMIRGLPHSREATCYRSSEMIHLNITLWYLKTKVDWYRNISVLPHFIESPAPPSPQQNKI